MAKNVVIVESNAKAKTIGKYLGKEFDVQASRGHIRDLPKDKFGVDLENGFEPTYRVMPASTRIVSKLRKAARDAETVYLAPDPDREGEAIAWHLQHVLNVPPERIRRVTFNEITRTAVRKAFEHSREVDINLVDAQQARRILDRIVGYQLSPLISKKVVRGLSAGRVQSVALRLIVDRERQRDAFEPVEYWEILAQLTHEGQSDRFEAQLARIDDAKIEVGTGDAAGALVAELKDAAYSVEAVKKRATSSKAPPPFITSTMQQGAHGELRMSASQTMRLAQQLYEGIEISNETVGLITYMRTDATRVADSALAEVREYIGGEFGADYLPGSPNRFRSPKGAQAAHEAVRPTSVSRTPKEMRPFLNDKQHKLYDLIWRRFVASQMCPARYDVTNVEIRAGRATFIAKGRIMTFPGYTRMTGRKEGKDQMLPDLTAGDALQLHELDPSQHFTQPPPRFSEASLVRELEKQGIGRPSTYAPTIRTLTQRNYVRARRRALCPTDLGLVVTDLLVENFPREMEVAFTSHMEEEFDAIEEGQRDWRSLLAEFYEQFSEDMERAKEHMKSVRGAEPDEPMACENCGKPMVVQFSRKGDKFLGCSGFPECKTTVNLAKPEDQGELTEHKCPKCDAPMLKRPGRRGRPYLACSAYPKCRNIMGLSKEGQPVELEQRERTGMACPKCKAPLHLQGDETPAMVCGRCGTRLPLMSVADAMEKTELPEDEPLALCEECHKPMEVKNSRNGMFLACSDAECRTTQPIPKSQLPKPVPTAERCELCGRPLAVRWGQYGRFMACTGFPQCRNLWKITGRRRRCKAEGCKARMMRKTDKEGNLYLGCTRFPDCDYTEPMPEETAKPKKKATKKKATKKKAVKKKAVKKKATKKKAVKKKA